MEQLGMLLLASIYVLGIAAALMVAAALIAILPWALALALFGSVNFLYFWGSGALVALGILFNLIG